MHQQAQQPFEMTQRKTKKEDDSALHHLFLMTASSKDTCCPCFTSLSHVESLTLYLSGVIE